METTYTPGPWMIVDPTQDDRVGESSYGLLGRLISEVNASFGNLIIADVLPVSPDINSCNPNARLIAAAPELLEALEECYKLLPAFKTILGEPADNIEAQQAYQKAKAAINKAKGI